MRYILLMFFVISAFSVKAQKFDEDKKIDQLVPGYVILEQGDSVKGKIKVQTRSKNQVRVKFTDKEGKKFTYKPKEILGYGYQTVVNNDSRQVVYYWRHFHQKKADMAPVPFGSKTVFMEVKAYGKAILYSYYVQRNEEVAMTYMHFYYLKFEDGSRERMITQDDFDWAVPAFLEDCKKNRNYRWYKDGVF